MRVCVPKTAFLFLTFLALASTLAFAWTEPVRMSDSLGLDAPKMIAVGETLHVIGTWPQAFYMRSNDNGLNWTEPIIPLDTTRRMETPDFKYSNGRIHLIWKEALGQPATFQLFHTSSNNGGRSWSSPHQVFNNSDRTMSFPSLAAKGDTLFAACAFSGYYMFFRSFNGGLNWRDSSIIDSGPLLINQPPILLYSASVLHLIYPMGVDVDSFSLEIYYRQSVDYGLTWSDRIILSPAELHPNGIASQIPSASADSVGHILICWMDYKYGSMCGISGDIFYRVSLDNGDTWQPWGSITNTQSGDFS